MQDLFLDPESPNIATQPRHLSLYRDFLAIGFSVPSHKTCVEELMVFEGQVVSYFYVTNILRVMVWTIAQLLPFAAQLGLFEETDHSL